MAGPVLLTFGVGISIRLWLFRTSIPSWLSPSNEITTPLTSWKRVTEGLALYSAGTSPYDGDVFHEMPIVLRILHYFTNVLGVPPNYLFIFCDIVIALLLERIGKLFGRYLLTEQRQSIKDYHVDATSILLQSNQMHNTRILMIAVYMMNPYTLMTCLAKSTAIFSNLAIVLVMLLTLQRRRLAVCFAVACAAYLSLYSVVLIVPAAIHLTHNIKPGSIVQPMKARMINISFTILTSLLFLGGLLYASFLLNGSWNFISSTYGFTLSVPDLTPNSGVFWYFFTEMFEHFRLFFICVFQINVFIYTIPLSVKLWNQPLFMMYMCLSLTAVFKSYPSVGDVSLYLSLLPLWKHIFVYMKNTFLVSCMFICCTILMPILYHLWIYAGSANANFYFAITLVYTTAQIFLLTDLLSAFLRREYDLVHGTKEVVINGKPAQVILD